MNYKRKKSKRQVRCTLCTKYRWFGNSKEGKSVHELRYEDIFIQAKKGLSL